MIMNITQRKVKINLESNLACQNQKNRLYLTRMTLNRSYVTVKPVALEFQGELGI